MRHNTPLFGCSMTYNNHQVSGKGVDTIIGLKKKIKTMTLQTTSSKGMPGRLPFSHRNWWNLGGHGPDT